MFVLLFVIMTCLEGLFLFATGVMKAFTRATSLPPLLIILLFLYSNRYVTDIKEIHSITTCTISISCCGVGGPGFKSWVLLKKHVDLFKLYFSVLFLIAKHFI